MYGFSVYLNEEIDRDHIDRMVAAGFTGIFTSIHIPEDDPTAYLDRMQDLGAIAKAYDLSLVVDISGTSLHKIGGSFEDIRPIIDLGVTGLRIDYGIGFETVARLSREIHIALNASTLTPQDLDQLHHYQADLSHITAWHNYYPRPETGLGMDTFKHHNRWLKSTSLRTMAFVPGDDKMRGPIHAGLPTVEAHRSLHPMAGTLDLITNGYIDDVYIGDPAISRDVLFQFKEYIEKNRICLRMESARDAVAEQVEWILGDHTNRQDAAALVVRSQESRRKLRSNDSIKAVNTSRRQFGAITVDNEGYGRYQGEVQICKVDLLEDEKVNVVGRVTQADRDLIAFIGPGQTFKLLHK
ncbi:DUF871 domain-containing protein [Aerococcus urinaeequi]|uniref:DUF871 domain-containing protein n=1 Tax=Aerococcus urinaeequi TaxID=51665 RepID=UPI00366F4B3B